MQYPDGILVRLFEPGDEEELRDVFSRVWLEDNRLYRCMGITREQLRPHVDSLMLRARMEPWTCALGIDTTSSPSQIVSFSFCRDFMVDVAPVDMSTLCPNMQRIYRINDWLLEPIMKNPLFSPLCQPRKLLYGLHAGTLPSHVGRDCRGTISTRVGAYAIPQILAMGFAGFVGNATHETTVERAYSRLDQGLSILVSRAVYRTWQDPTDGSTPFAAITELVGAVCEISIMNPQALSVHSQSKL